VICLVQWVGGVLLGEWWGVMGASGFFFFVCVVGVGLLIRNVMRGISGGGVGWWWWLGDGCLWV